MAGDAKADVYFGVFDGQYHDRPFTLTLLENCKLTLSDRCTMGCPNATVRMAEGSMVEGTMVGGSPESFLAAQWGNVYVDGNASIGNTMLQGDVHVAEGKKLTFFGEVDYSSYTINLGEGAALDLGGNTYKLEDTRISRAGNATIGNGTLIGNLTVEEGKSLALLADTTIQGSVTLKAGSTFDMGGNTFHLDGEEGNRIVLNGSISAIGNGTLIGDLAVAQGDTLTLCGNLSGTGSISLGNEATLDLGKHTYSGPLSMKGDSATIGNGTLERDLSVGDGKTLNLCGDLGGSDTISMSGSATLNIGTHTLSKNVTLNGTSTVKAENTTIKALNTDKEGLLKELSVSDGLIAGTGRAASLADGLKIESTADLMIQSMTITANNEIHVGENTITLRDVTIKISEDYFDRENPVDGVYYFKLQDLFHCDVEFNNVVFDATDLTLPQGFDPSKDAIGLDFGNEVNIDMTDGMYLHMGGDWSHTMSLVDGKPVFTKLVPTPEPATSTLGLLALAALAARRRKN